MIRIMEPTQNYQTRIDGNQLFPKDGQSKPDALAWYMKHHKDGTRIVALVQAQGGNWLLHAADRTIAVGCDIEGSARIEGDQLIKFYKWFRSVN